MGQAPDILPQPADVELTLDVSMWPLVLLTMPKVMTVADLDYLEAGYRSLHASFDRHALIVDPTTFDRIPDAALRGRMKEFESKKHHIIVEKNLGTAIIVQNSLVRGAFTALRWMSPAPTENRAFPNIRDAAAWCVELIEADGQFPPMDALRLADLLDRAAND
ncbi:MAG: hypothetical protein AAGF92_18880 [Myxococcota bacterium]